LRSDDDRDRETEPFQVDPLDRWQLQDEAVRRAQRGDRPPADPLALARATGRLPVGGHGAAAFAGLDDEVSAFLRTLQRSGPLGRATVRLQLDGFTIHGELDGVGRDALVDARIASQKPKDLLRGWLLHVLAAVARCQGADLPERTRLVAKDKVVELAPLDPATATDLLAGLLDGYRTGTTAPLPFFEHSSFAYGKAWNRSHDRSDALHKARQRWLSGASEQYSNADLDDADIALCFRGQDPVASPPFAAWAERIWSPCLQFSGPEDDA
jgi:exodeoxyribonuclease V gamma subunit